MALRASFTFVAALYIASADTCDLSHLPLTQRRSTIQPVPQADYQTLLFIQTGVNAFSQLLYGLPGTDLFQQVKILADHVHQRQRRAIRSGLNEVRQGYILSALAQAAKVH